jgi:hemolysin D
MGGAQRYPSIAVREGDGFREGLNPSYALSESNEPAGQELLYSERVAIDATQMQVEDRMVNLAPGMAVTVEIKAATRRIIEYLMSPLLRYRHDSLRER